MSSNGVPIQDISDTVGHKSTHVTEAVYRHVIVPEIRGGATVMDDVFTTTKTTQTRAMEKPRAFRHFAWHLTFEQKPDKSVELRGFEPLTFCMPCRRATSCAIAPQPTEVAIRRPVGGTQLAYRLRARVSYSNEDARQAARPPPRRSARWPRTLTPMSTDPHRATPTGKPRARSLGLTFRGTAGPWNAITDVPGVEVGYETLIQGDKVRTGVTAIHPRGKNNPGDPVAAGFHSQNGNGEMTGVSWIEESGTFEGPVAITNTHSVGIAHAGIISWMNRYHPEFTEVWLLPVAAETWDGYLNDINGRHVTEETVIAALEAARHEQPDEGSVGGGTGMNCYQFKAGGNRVPPNRVRRHHVHRRRVRAGQLRPPGRAHGHRHLPRRGVRRRQPDA